MTTIRFRAPRGRTNQKIIVIKAIRMLTSWDLKKAKDFVDEAEAVSPSTYCFTVADTFFDKFRNVVDGSIITVNQLISEINTAGYFAEPETDNLEEALFNLEEALLLAAKIATNRSDWAIASKLYALLDGLSIKRKNSIQNTNNNVFLAPQNHSA